MLNTLVHHKPVSMGSQSVLLNATGWLNEDSLRIRMIMPILSQFQDNESNNVRYFAWLADGNDAVSWMRI